MNLVQSSLVHNDALIKNQKSQSVFLEAKDLISLGLDIYNLSPCITNDVKDNDRQKYIALRANILQITSMLKAFLTIAEQVAQMAGILTFDDKYYGTLLKQLPQKSNLMMNSSKTKSNL